MTLFIIEIWTGNHWEPIPETITSIEAIAYRRMEYRKSTHPHIRYRVARYVRVMK
jgi:hypothetical protein